MVILLGWSAITLLKQGYQSVPLPTADSLKFSAEALGFLKHTDWRTDSPPSLPFLASYRLRAFRAGHEWRGIAGPGQPRAGPSQAENLKRAAIIIAVYSFVFYRTHRAPVS